MIRNQKEEIEKRKKYEKTMNQGKRALEKLISLL